MEYRANFLWGFADDSLESLGYEFANAKTEAYQKECWEALVQKIKDDCAKQILNEETAKDLPKENCNCFTGTITNVHCPVHGE